MAKGVGLAKTNSRGLLVKLPRVPSATFKCTTCDSKFFTEITLIHHLESQHQRNTHLCHECNSSFHRYRDYKRHSTTVHHPAATAQCCHCKYTSHRLDLMKRHTTRMHNLTGLDVAYKLIDTVAPLTTLATTNSLNPASTGNVQDIPTPSTEETHEWTSPSLLTFLEGRGPPPSWWPQDPLNLKSYASDTIPSISSFLTSHRQTTSDQQQTASLESSIVRSNTLHSDTLLSPYQVSTDAISPTPTNVSTNQYSMDTTDATLLATDITANIDTQSTRDILPTQPAIPQHKSTIHSVTEDSPLVPHQAAPELIPLPTTEESTCQQTEFTVELTSNDDFSSVQQNEDDISQPVPDKEYITPAPPRRKKRLINHQMCVEHLLTPISGHNILPAGLIYCLDL